VESAPRVTEQTLGLGVRLCLLLQPPALLCGNGLFLAAGLETKAMAVGDVRCPWDLSVLPGTGHQTHLDTG
jgi:hypothetical protein